MIQFGESDRFLRTVLVPYTTIFFFIIVDLRINETLCTGAGKIRAMTPVGAVSNRTASAQLETVPTKHGEVMSTYFPNLP